MLIKERIAFSPSPLATILTTQFLEELSVTVLDIFMVVFLFAARTPSTSKSDISATDVSALFIRDSVLSKLLPLVLVALPSAKSQTYHSVSVPYCSWAAKALVGTELMSIRTLKSNARNLFVFIFIVRLPC